MTQEEQRNNLIEAERLIREVEQSIMPPSMIRADLNAARTIVMETYTRLP